MTNTETDELRAAISETLTVIFVSKQGQTFTTRQSFAIIGARRILNVLTAQETELAGVLDELLKAFEIDGIKV